MKFQCRLVTDIVYLTAHLIDIFIARCIFERKLTTIFWVLPFYTGSFETVDVHIIILIQY